MFLFLELSSGQIDDNSVIGDIDVVDECFPSADNVFQMEPKKAVNVIDEDADSGGHPSYL